MGAWYWIILVVVVVGYSGLWYAVGWYFGERHENKRFHRELEFVRRAPINPTDQPHARKPGGRSRVTEAHMSQPRADWSAE